MAHYYYLTICYSPVYILKDICMLLSAIKQGLCNTHDHHIMSHCVLPRMLMEVLQIKFHFVKTLF